MQSIDLADCRTVDAIVTKLRGGDQAPGAWVRAIGYDERLAGLPDRDMLDTWLPDHPLRVQDRTGGFRSFIHWSLTPDYTGLARTVPPGR